MLTVQDLKALCAAHSRGAEGAVNQLLDRLGNPSGEEIVNAALQNMQSADRNLRVVMLRLLTRYPSAEGKAGILAGLTDKARRVRRVAIQAAQAFLQHPEVVKKLQEIVGDAAEVRKIRSAALAALAGLAMGAAADRLPAPAAAALGEMVKSPQYRQQVLFSLLRLNLTPGVEELLRDFVKHGSKEEAVMATRALCGYRVANLGEFAEGERQRVSQTCEPAAGRVFYWVRREEL